MTRAMKSRTATREVSARKAAPPARKANAGWTIRRARGLQIVESLSLDNLGWLVHGFSTRAGGASEVAGKSALNLGFTDWDDRANVVKNRAAFSAALSAREMPLLAMRQFHSDLIYFAAAVPAEAPKADALVRHEAGMLLAVQTADCVPILLADTRLRVVAAIHAGWRGTLSRIIMKTLGRMQMEFGTRPRDIVAALGPAIGRCCYEVGSDVARLYAAQFPNAAEWFDGPFDQLANGEDPLWLPWLTMMPPGHVPPAPKAQLDLRASNRWQLIDSGVPAAQIEVSDLCTSCRADLFFSYRREREKTGRMMAVIGIRGK